ncbi:hypothetical protein DICPUDRAFT_80858 [Dictyostelium purpureum]|uniref:Saposin B-type domain-containing protein n=1 Tax=Dictyostelium purpureum TaxID=5786 RepID=F0ZRR6_DICPU|nr:uncharacterized protein DICPUDRAFT_80858 [Dictyostelium purpureum]EGC33365.1 hypothetical protein DICPUDRAFT_80858 [Dictyostelium purpureum]|eukprot:XP_003290116.1 hypothetical protein DICPUDRAFT_80858 [Dictyostelium purpureum]
MKYLIIVLLAILAFLSITGKVSASENFDQENNCNFCEFIVEYIEDYVKENQTEAEIKEEIEEVCLILPDSLQEPCKILISNNIGKIIHMLVNDASPRDICNFFKFCSPTPPPSQPKQQHTIKGKSTIECNVCEYIVSNVYRYITLNSTEAQIINALENDCSLLGGNLAITCQGLVNEYIPMIINLIENNEDPSTICGQIKLCAISNNSNIKIMI